MNATRLLLRLYPSAWRDRYGEELEALIAESAGGSVAWRVRLDVAVAGVREQLRSWAMAGDGVPPEEKSWTGTLVVLYAWALFVVAGVVVQKASEHWQAVTPAGRRGVPAAAFDLLVEAAAVGSLLVLVGVVRALPAFWVFLRSGGWPRIRRPVMVAAALSVLVAATLPPLLELAHGLTPAQRNGADARYAVVVAGWGLLAVTCLAAWTIAAAVTARRIPRSPALVRFEARLAAGVAACMAVMTGAAAVWWAALDRAAPWVFAGRPVGAPNSTLAPQLAGAVILMVAATALATAGAVRALR